jgi:hypothetical protein
MVAIGSLLGCIFNNSISCYSTLAGQKYPCSGAAAASAAAMACVFQQRKQHAGILFHLQW